MCWTPTQLAEIRRCHHQSSPKMVHPNSIDDDTCDQRMPAAGEPFGKRQAATRGWQGLVLERKLRALTLGRSHEVLFGERRAKEVLVWGGRHLAERFEAMGEIEVAKQVMSMSKRLTLGGSVKLEPNVEDEHRFLEPMEHTDE